MKKVFRSLALALVVMAMTTACNNNTEETPLDTMPIEVAAIDTTPVVDTVVMEEETPAPAPAPAKKKTTAKKQQPKPATPVSTEKKQDDGITITTGTASIKMKKGDDGKLSGETTITTNDGTTIQTNNLGKMKKH